MAWVRKKECELDCSAIFKKPAAMKDAKRDDGGEGEWGGQGEGEG